MSLYVSVLPKDGFIRAATLAKLLEISVVTVWRWAAKGKLPQPVKLSERVTAWRVEEIKSWLENNGRAN